MKHLGDQVYHVYIYFFLSFRIQSQFADTHQIITGYRVMQILGYIPSNLIVHMLFYWKERYQIAHLKGLAGASTVHLFADDTIAYLTIKSNRDCNKLQNDFDKLSIWEQKWKMVLTSLLLQNSFILSRTYILTIIRNTPLSFLNIYFNE